MGSAPDVTVLAGTPIPAALVGVSPDVLVARVLLAGEDKSVLVSVPVVVVVVAVALMTLNSDDCILDSEASSVVLPTLSDFELNTAASEEAALAAMMDSLMLAHKLGREY